MAKLVKKIRDIELQLVLIRNDEAMSFQERMDRTWELQSRLRLAHSRLVEEVEAQAS